LSNFNLPLLTTTTTSPKKRSRQFATRGKLLVVCNDKLIL
jgi:hypothetical protein